MSSLDYKVRKPSISFLIGYWFFHPIVFCQILITIFIYFTLGGVTTLIIIIVLVFVYFIIKSVQTPDPEVNDLKKAKRELNTKAMVVVARNYQKFKLITKDFENLGSSEEIEKTQIYFKNLNFQDFYNLKYNIFIRLLRLTILRKIKLFSIELKRRSPEQIGIFDRYISSIENSIESLDIQRLKSEIKKMQKMIDNAKTFKFIEIKNKLASLHSRAKIIIAQYESLKNKIQKVENLFNKPELGDALRLLKDYKNEIVEFGSKRIIEKSNILFEQITGEIEQKKLQIGEITKKVRELVGKNNFDEAYVELKQIKRLYSHLGSEDIAKTIYPVKIESIHDYIKNREIKYNLTMELVQLLKKFPRIHLLEVSQKTNISSDRTEELIKELIEEGEIKAKYDEDSKGVESLYTMDELDTLIRQYEEWEKIGEGKKS